MGIAVAEVDEKLTQQVIEIVAPMFKELGDEDGIKALNAFVRCVVKSPTVLAIR